MRKILADIDAADLLLVAGTVSLIGGVAAIYKPAAAIVFGLFCLYLWMAKSRRVE